MITVSRAREYFIFEGGCYAKTYNLRQDLEPEIFQATKRFENMTEYASLDPEARSLDFADKLVTENGRSTYSISALPHIVGNGRGSVLRHFFFFAAIVLGLLPLIARLDHQDATRYFLIGLTVKVAGTEMGMEGITATFPHYFGAFL